MAFAHQDIDGAIALHQRFKDECRFTVRWWWSSLSMFAEVATTGMSMASEVESASLLLCHDVMAVALLCRRILDRVDTFV